ncbi:MAG: hypothetical protein M1389_04510 [Chloroflexi bacterium]|nr:hypothetical protein [Chloroflexota bacterium]
MNWLEFFIGGLLGWLIGWLIDFLVCRPRREAANADLRLSLDNAHKESASLNAKLAAYEGMQVRLDGASGEIDLLRAQVASVDDLQLRLNAELASVRLGVVTPGAADGERAHLFVPLTSAPVGIPGYSARTRRACGGFSPPLLKASNSCRSRWRGAKPLAERPEPSGVPRGKANEVTLRGTNWPLPRSGTEVASFSGRWPQHRQAASRICPNAAGRPAIAPGRDETRISTG